MSSSSSERVAAQLTLLTNALAAASKVGDTTRLIAEIRDRIDVVYTPEYPNFLHSVFPPLRELLMRKTKEQFEDTSENRIRHGVLSILHKLPCNDVLKPYVYELMDLSLKIVEVDNEENACVALKIILSLHKSYHPSLDNYVQVFLDLVIKMYETMHYTSQTVLTQSLVTATGTVPLIRSMESFKALEQCPVIVMMIFQAYGKFNAKIMPKLLPLMVSVLQLNPVTAAPMAAVSTYTSLQKQRYREFTAAQVRTLQVPLHILNKTHVHVLSPLTFYMYVIIAVCSVSFTK